MAEEGRPARGTFGADSWNGSYYELAIDCGPAGDDERLAAMLRGIWSLPALEGPWASRAFRVPVNLCAPPVFEALRTLYGTAAVEGAAGEHIGCVTDVVREESPGAHDWLDLSLPTGMLSRVFRVEHPLWPRERNPWMGGVDQTLLRAAEAAYDASPFDLALIGEEVSGWTRAEELTVDEAAKGGYLLSPASHAQLGEPPRPPVRLASGLLWFPYPD